VRHRAFSDLHRASFVLIRPESIYMKFIKQRLPKLNRPAVSSPVPVLAQQSRIPHIVHQTFPSKTLPAELEANRQKIQANNPGWECRLYDDDDIEKFLRDSYGPAVWRAFDRVSRHYGAARADLFRYLLLYKCGGVYLDIKSSAEKPFSQVLRDDDQFILSYWENGPGEKFEGFGLHAELGPLGEFQQWFIIAAPGHPFLKAVIDNILRNVDLYFPSLHGVGQYGVIRVTGPIAYTLAIEPIRGNHSYRLANSDTELGLAYTIFKVHSHKTLFKKTHYTILKSSIVELNLFKRCLESVLARGEKIQNALLARR
jgi:mannosyltransferase OCH1-like enzyme